jgi:hypothetical protein
MIMTDPQTDQPAPPMPTPCRWLLYTLTDEDARAINRRRADTARHRPAHVENANGVQIHIGNEHYAGDQLPMLVVHVWDDDRTVNGQVFLDGNDTLWKTSVKLGDGPGTAMWPPRV